MARARMSLGVRIAVSCISLIGAAAVWGGHADSRGAVVSMQAAGQDRPATPPAPVPAGTASLTVQVVAAEAGTPVRGARLMVFGMVTTARSQAAAVPSAGVSISTGATPARDAAPALPRVQREGRTDGDGMASFTGLPAGQYSVIVVPPAAFINNESARPVQVADGAEVSTVVRLDRGGVIAGRLFDEFGEPVTGAAVTVFRLQKFAGTRRPVRAGSSLSTNDLGQFRVWALPAGDYVVSAVVRDYRTFDSEGPSEVAGRDGVLPTFYPGVAAFDGATPVPVKAGQETGGLDFSLASGRLGSVSGRITDSAGESATQTGSGRFSVVLSSRTSTPGFDGRGASVRPDGTYSVNGVPPGEYVVSAVRSSSTGKPGETREGAYAPVAVNGDDVVVNLQTNLGATVSGRVVVEAAAPPAAAGSPGSANRPNPVRVMLQPATASGVYSTAFTNPRPATVGPDGTFEITGVRGPVQVSAMGGRGALKAVTRGGRDISGQSFELSGTEQIDDVVVVLTEATGMIDGVVKDESDEPVAGAAVLVFPDSPSRWSAGSPFVQQRRTAAAGLSGEVTAQSVQAGMDGAAVPMTPGRFRAAALPAGRYVVVALPAGMSYVPPDPDMLARLRETGKVVTVEAGQTTTVELTPVK